VTDQDWMQQCIDLARCAQGRTAPNPMVGALVVRDGVVLAEGFHREAGDLHAECMVLESLGGDLSKATMYVNLEPCCHVGRTGPCTDAILGAGVGRVVVGMVDPNPLVHGKGIAQLQAAGVELEVGVLQEACEELNAGYSSTFSKGRPQVWLKAAATLNGAIADASGASKWITGTLAREHVHELRNRMDAVLVGSGTLLADDPALTTRTLDGRDALRVVLDTNLCCPESARLFEAEELPLIYCASDAQERDLPATVVRVARSDAGLDLEAVLADLAARGVHNLLVEGGGQLHRSFLDAGLADRLLLFLAPKLLPGGKSFVGGAPIGLDEAPSFDLVNTVQLGPDLLLEYRLEG